MCRMDEKRLISAVIVLAGLTSIVMYLNISDNSYVTHHVIVEDQPTYTEDMYMPPVPSVVKRDMGHYLCILHTNVVSVYAPGSDAEILQCILTRFGYLKELFVTLPLTAKNAALGRGYDDVRRTQYLRPSGVMSPQRVYREDDINIFAQPARYDREIMNEMFPENARYITILRKPLHRFISDFIYSRLDKHFNTTEDSGSPKDYLDNPEFWEARKTTHYCTRNCMSAVLGFPLDETIDVNYTQEAMEYVKKIDSKFTLVLIYEYLDQSLVLLKRYMCWSFTDIMYYVRSTQLRDQETLERASTEAHVRSFRRLNTIDYLVYDYFNKTLWRKVAAEGKDFLEEVKNFQNIQKEVLRFCRAAMGSKAAANQTFLHASKWNKKFDFTRGMCYMLGKGKRAWDALLKERYFG